MTTASQYLSSLIVVLIGCLPGFLVGLWAARSESKRRRLAVATIVGVGVFTTPFVVGFVAQYV